MQVLLVISSNLVQFTVKICVTVSEPKIAKFVDIYTLEVCAVVENRKKITKAAYFKSSSLQCRPI